MKRLSGYLFLLYINSFYAQQDIGKQINDIKTKIDNPSVFINYQSAFEAKADEKAPIFANFVGKMFRVELRGNLTDKLFYRVRYRMNKDSKTTADRLSDAADMMLVGYRINDRLSVTIGKMGQNWGGFEYELNPMNVYEYSDYVNNMEAFLIGGLVYYQYNPHHNFSININNISTKDFETIYGQNIGVKQSSMPLSYVLTWAGSFKDGMFRTRWSLGYNQQAKNHSSKMIILGNKFFFSEFNFFLDYSFAQEDLDRLKYAKIYSLVPDKIPKQLENVFYHSVVSRMEYQPNAKWVYSLQGMYETADVKQNLPSGVYNASRKALGYSLGVEWLPFSKENLRFYTNYSGKHYFYKFKEMNTYTHYFNLGIMYRMKIF